MPEYVLEHGDVQLSAFASFLTYYVPARILQIFETVDSAWIQRVRTVRKDRNRSRGTSHASSDNDTSQDERR